MTKPLARGTQQVATGEERRRSQRVMICCPVTLEIAVAGHKVTIQAATVSVNDQGAMLLCSRALAAETQFQMQNERTKQTQICRVVRAPVERTDGFLIPVEFTAVATNFWGISFPPANWKNSEG